MIELGANYIRLSKNALFHMKPSDLLTVSCDGTHTRIVVYSKNGFTKLEVVVPKEELSVREVVKTFEPKKFKLH